MADKRRLQGEIERCLKKVTEGVETFEDIWQKVHNATNSNQKEKYESDLKKEIKKLQRLRDQIKTWLASSDIKDKRQLVENRKLIETQMERFKVVERETKTKAYSKEGLGAAQKLDPAQQEKDEINQWLSNSINALNLQSEQYESEIESLLASFKKKRDKEKESQIEKIKSSLHKHRFHIVRLETILRKLDNMTLDVDQIKTIKDDVEYYIEDPEQFEDSETIYDDLDLDSVAETIALPKVAVEDVVTSTVASLSSSTQVSATPATSSTPIAASITTTTTSALPTNTTSHTIASSASLAFTSASGAPPSVASAISSAQSNSNFATTNQDQHHHPTRQQHHLQQQPQQIQQQSQSHQSQALHLSHAATHPSTASVAAASTVGQSIATSSPISQPPTSTSATVIAAMQADIKSVSASSVESQQAEHLAQVQATQKRLTQAVAATAGVKKLVDDISGSTAIKHVADDSAKITGPGLLNATNTDAINQRQQQQHQHQQDSPTNNQNLSTMIPPLLGVAPLGPVSLSKSCYYQLAMLDAAAHHQIYPSDSQRLRLYLPPTRYQSPPYYPQTALPHSDTAEFFQRLSTETLFFIFYFMEGTKAQYLAAKALKKQSWRFHTKYMMWFQRHEEPKSITDEYEQGTYIYFDYDKWGQRKKEGFTFEYRYLEDRDLN